MLKEVARDLREVFFNKTEIDFKGQIWVQDKACPIQVGGLPCPGKLKKKVFENKIELSCTNMPFYHSITIPRV